ncbi:hypothetical protein TNCV_1832191 [Trichonephila clavipes]|nr:hypothetical protein TNCV_1832191 [Trichonephila clavipes]
MRDDRGESNHKTRYRSCITSSFQISPGSACSILMNLSASEDTKNTRDLISLDIVIRVLPLISRYWAKSRSRRGLLSGLGSGPSCPCPEHKPVQWKRLDFTTERCFCSTIQRCLKENMNGYWGT